VLEWKPFTVNSRRLPVRETIDEAKIYISKFKASGWTNINEALLTAIRRSNVIAQNEDYHDVQQMIFFLTDGTATIGETNDNKIFLNVEKENDKNRIPIYGLAFGEAADFNMVSKISDKTNGFAKRIYESGRSQEQLEDIYLHISDPKLKNVKFEYFYDGKLIQEGSMSTSNFVIINGGTPTVVVGNFDNTIAGIISPNPIFQLNVAATASQNHSYTDFIKARSCRSNRSNICNARENDCYQNRRCNGKIELKAYGEKGKK
jgi:hypothetical protein